MATLISDLKTASQTCITRKTQITCTTRYHTRCRVTAIAGEREADPNTEADPRPHSRDTSATTPLTTEAEAPAQAAPSGMNGHEAPPRVPSVRLAIRTKEDGAPSTRTTDPPSGKDIVRTWATPTQDPSSAPTQETTAQPTV